MDIIFNNKPKHPTDKSPCDHFIVQQSKGTHELSNYTYTSCVICNMFLHHLSRDGNGNLYRKNYDYNGWSSPAYEKTYLKNYKKNIKNLKQVLFKLKLTKSDLQIINKKI